MSSDDIAAAVTLIAMVVTSERPRLAELLGEPDNDACRPTDVGYEYREP